ncbi:unnamed protein product [Blepharisma stoltei]|uniref:Uncharacterized protein n=1 Tax=Blepharisma stoltei TaxID=1481888 RepID=A0AAU9ICK7_9CILI|nr:unnamed protein product [Blepharisma stoltei]
MSSDRNFSKIRIELQIIQSGTSQDISIPNIDSKLIACNQNDNFLIQPLLKFLSDHHQNLEHTMVSLFSSIKKVFVYSGNYPLPGDLQVSANEFISNSTIKLRFRYTRDYESSKTAQVEQGAEEDNESDSGAKGSKRTKERKVGVIIEKVAQWRNLYNGVPNSNGEMVRLTLEEAATKVGISKKSLDDYLLQLRFGRKYGFNFEEHKNDKVGLLRAFVKKFKKIQSDLSKVKPGETIPSELEQQINEKGTPLCKSKKCCVPPSGILKVPGQSSN